SNCTPAVYFSFEVSPSSLLFRDVRRRRESHCAPVCFTSNLPVVLEVLVLPDVRMLPNSAEPLQADFSSSAAITAGLLIRASRLAVIRPDGMRMMSSQCSSGWQQVNHRNGLLQPWMMAVG